MNDTYCELIVKRKIGSTALLSRFLVVFATVVAMFLGFAMFHVFGIMAGCFLIYLDIIVFRNTDTEYEYQFISGDLDIDCIYGKMKRKKAKHFDMRRIELLAPLKSGEFASYDHNKKIKIMDYSSGYDDRPKYALIVPTDDNEIAKVIFEPNEEMVNAIKMIAPSKVHMY